MSRMHVWHEADHIFWEINFLSNFKQAYVLSWLSLTSNECSIGLTEFQLSDLLKTTPSLIICDLRKKEDFAKGHIKKSVLAKFDEKNLLDIPQNSKIVLVSYNEEQSKKMATTLRSHNIDVYYLIGGIRNYTGGLYCTNISYVGTGYP